MTDEQLIAAIRNLAALKQVTLGEIEKALKMPQNCLSGMLSGSRNLTPKWRDLLLAYVQAKMNGATEIVISIGQPRPSQTLKENIEKNNLPENKKQILKQRATLTPLPEDNSEKPSKTPPPGLTKSQQLRWHRENNQTLQ